MKTLAISWHSDAHRLTCNGFDIYLPAGNTPCVALDNGVVLILEGWKWRFMVGEHKVTRTATHLPGGIKLTGEFSGFTAGSMMEVK